MSRFSKLAAKLKSKGDRNPRALAAWIGRKKYGKAEMNRLAARGRLLARRKS